VRRQEEAFSVHSQERIMGLLGAMIPHDVNVCVCDLRVCYVYNINVFVCYIICMQCMCVYVVSIYKTYVTCHFKLIFECTEHSYRR